MIRDEAVELLWTESDEQFPGRITREGCEWVVDLLIERGLLPTETEWAIWREYDNQYFIQVSEEAARGGSALVQGFLTSFRRVTPWRVAAAEVNAQTLPDEPESEHDPRWAYAELTKEQAYAAWPCATCGVRRDEHADQTVQSTFPNLDITDHEFQEPE